LVPYFPYLALSNISPNNKVNKNNNGQPYQKEHFDTSGRHIWHTNTLSTRRHHQATNGNRGGEAESVRGLGVLCRLQFSPKVAAGKGHETYFSNHELKAKWFEE
jgi:hypothetical protein